MELQWPDGQPKEHSLKARGLVTDNVLCTACLLSGKHLPHEAAARILASRERMLRTGSAFQRAVAIPDLDHTPTVGELLFFGALHCASWLLEFPDGPTEG